MVYHVIGMMSGTSLDGVDIAYVQFYSKDSFWKYEILEAETLPYPLKWRHDLAEAFVKEKQYIEQLDKCYAYYLGQCCQDFITKYNIKQLDLIASHGHTVFHKPEVGVTCQIGNLPDFLAAMEMTVPLVCDFRTADVVRGGQGAPLVPIGDRLLFSEYKACLNLGGFANISYENEKGVRIAFDIVAVNTVLNALVQNRGLEYDPDGTIAQSGKVDGALLEALNSLDYYNKSAPKSLGVEYVKEVVLPLLETYKLASEDLLCTFVEHIAIQISKSIPHTLSTVLVTGGGVYNQYLTKRISYHSGAEIIVPDANTIDFKEALIFALLGLLRLQGQINVLASVTGVDQDHSSGIIWRKEFAK